ncbi:hypothetical protein SMMN14_07971 [Sphaerulina musiva]
MDKTTSALLLFRAIQMLAAALVLSLSISLYRTLHIVTHHYDDKQHLVKKWLNPWISSVGFGAAVGALGMLDAIVGIVSAFLNIVPWVAVLTLDILAAMFFLASGLTFAIMSSNPFNPRPCGSIVRNGNEGVHLPLCSHFTADDGFMFIGVLATIAAAALALVPRRSSKFRGTGSTPISRQF